MLGSSRPDDDLTSRNIRCNEYQWAQKTEDHTVHKRTAGGYPPDDLLHALWLRNLEDQVGI